MSWTLWSLPSALVSYCCCNKLLQTSWLKKTLIFLLQRSEILVPEVRNPTLVSLGSVSWHGWFLLESLRRDSVSSPWSSSRVCLLSLVCDPFLVPPQPLAPCHVLRTLIFLPPSYKDLGITLVSPRSSKVSCHLKIFKLITTTKFLLPWKVMNPQISRIRMWIF